MTKMSLSNLQTRDEPVKGGEKRTGESQLLLSSRGLFNIAHSKGFMTSLPAAIREGIVFPSDTLMEALCSGLRCGIREGRAGLEKVRWLESRYASALWSALRGEKSAALATEIRFVEVELKEIYVSAGIAKALGIVAGAELSAADLLSRLTQQMATVAVRA